MGFFSEEHPYTAVTEYIDRMTGASYEEDDLSGLPDLIEVVKIQRAGVHEAARAIRKKLKYGSHHQQLRALTILEALVGNAGKSFQREFGDEMLLERLRTMATDASTDREIKQKLANILIGWSQDFKDVPSMSRVAHLKDSLPRRTTKAAPTVRPPTPDPDSDEDEAPAPSRSRGHSRHASGSGPSTPKQPARPTHNSPTSKYTYVEPTTPPKERSSFFGGSHSKKSSVPKDKRPVKVSLETEAPKILQTIAAANQASTNLQNALKHVNKEDSSFLSDPNIVKFHKSCRDIRRLILHYIAGIESEEWVGTLLQTNDALVSALQLYEEYKQIATAPDSDEEEQREMTRRHMTSIHGVDDQDSAAPPRKPARPSRPAVVESESDDATDDEDEVEGSIISEGDENDPFGNQHANNALATPALEKSQPKW